MAPSPITAMTLWVLPPRSRATAMPSPAEIEVEEWPAPKASYSLSSRLQKPESPPGWRRVRMRLTATGQDLVGIGLMTYVPHQPVVRRIEDMMQRDCELDHAKACAEMASSGRHSVDHHLPHLARELFQLGIGESAQIGRRVDAVKQGSRILGGVQWSAFFGKGAKDQCVRAALTAGSGRCNYPMRQAKPCQ